MNDGVSGVSAVPPAERSLLWKEINAAADQGTFRLQVCASCERAQYPPRDLCELCLGDKLVWSALEPAGAVISFTRLHVSHVEFFRTGGPWPVGLVKLDCGPILYAYLSDRAMKTGCRVAVAFRRDCSGQAVLVAVRCDEDTRHIPGPLSRVF